MAAPTLVSFTQIAQTSTGTSAASSSVSWQAGDVVAVICGNEGSAAFSAPTATGLTFGVQKSNSAANTCCTAAYAATAASSGSGAITIHQGSGGGQMGAGIWVLRGGAVGTSFEQHTTTKTKLVTPSGVDSAFCWGIFDFGAGVNGGSVLTPTVTNTRQNGIRQTGHYTYWIGDLDDDASSSAQSFGITSGTASAGPFSIIGIEITPPAPAGPSIVQVAGADDNTTPPYTLAFPSPVTAGNALFAFISGDHPSMVDATVSDNVNGSWSAISGSKETTFDTSQWYRLPTPAAGGSTTVTATGSGYDGIVFFIVEVSGVSFTIDDSNGSSGSGTSASTTLTTVTDGCMILGACRATSSATVDGAWTDLVDDGTGDVSEFKIQTTHGSISVPFANASGSWAVSAIALPPASGAGAGASATVRFGTAATGARASSHTAAAAMRLLPAVTGRRQASASASATVRFTPAVAGGKASSSSASATLRFGTAAAGTGAKGSAAGASVKFGTSVQGQRVAIGSHEEASPAPPFTTIVEGAIDHVAFTTSATGNASEVHSGSASATVRFGAAPAGRKQASGAASATLRFVAAAAGHRVGSAPSSATARLAGQATGQRASAGVAQGTIRFATAATGGRPGESASSATLRFLTSAAGARSSSGAMSASTKLATTASGARSSSGGASAAVRFSTAAAGTASEVHSGAAAASVSFTIVVAGRRSSVSPASATIRFTAAATGQRGGQGGAASAQVRFSTSVTGARASAGLAAARVRLITAAAGENPADLDHLPVGRRTVLVVGGNNTTLVIGRADDAP